MRLKGLPAIAFQHELDHLNGVMFYDRINEKIHLLIYLILFPMSATKISLGSYYYLPRLVFICILIVFPHLNAH